MKLSDIHILEKIAAGKIAISPSIPDEHIGSFSIDLRLGNHFKVFKYTQCPPFINLGTSDSLFTMCDQFMEDIIVEDDKAFYLHPGELALGITIERITLPNDIAGWLDGRSSLARLGLMIHVTAHTIDPGWDGQITLEFANIGKLPLALRPGMRICAVSFEQLSGPTSRPYSEKKGAKYTGQISPLSSRIDKDE
ncbi:dCTP deaminase [Candidatus Parabeggiatoa sp. HSG14]|uniref:dCTP deaminase n=1 Tax=Candidatus Parabeggiatoa sp. HSG14 TaxID=3055593 RepID=UPI0025A91A37|nr:dCTP deaminase [Thiotrichales bacterium HSG14]